MRGGALPPALLCAALGFALAYAPLRWRLPSIIALCVGASLAWGIGIDKTLEEVAFAGCWMSVVLTSLSLHLPGVRGPRLLLPLALNAGVWSGAVVSVGGELLDLFIALPLVLICYLAAVLLATPLRLGVKIAASWLAAVAILAGAVALTPTAGYQPDHRE